MKKIFSVLVCLLLSLSIYAQGKVTFADSNNASEAKTLGVFHF